jgi:hypothetical protein
MCVKRGRGREGEEKERERGRGGGGGEGRENEIFKKFSHAKVPLLVRKFCPNFC